MKPIRILIALIAFLIPILARTLWFYQGVYHRQAAVETPQYSSYVVPQPEISPLKVLEGQEKDSGKNEKVVLFDLNHANTVTLSELELLKSDLTALGARLEVSDSQTDFSQQLKYADAYVVIAPLYSFYPEEIQRVQHFVERGGRLLVIADPTRDSNSYDGSDMYYGTSMLSSVDISNLLLAPYQITFQDDYLYNLVENEGNFRNIIFDSFEDDVLMENLSRVVLYGAHSINGRAVPLLTGDKNTLSSMTDQGGRLAAGMLKEVGDGQVLALGDMNFMTLPFNQINDNARLTENVARFLSEGERLHNLEDFPYLFTRPVIVSRSEDKPLDSDMLDLLSVTQNSLSRFNINVEIGTKPRSGYDLMLVDVYPEDGKFEADVETYLKPFDLKFSYDKGRSGVKEEISAPADDDLEGNNLAKTSTATPETEAEHTPTPKVEEGGTATPAADEENTPTPKIDAGEEESWDGNKVNTVEIPAFGKVSLKDIGIILYDSSEKRNTLILLAEDSESFQSLAEMLLGGALTDCVVQGKIAVCKLDGSSSSYDYDSSGDSNSYDNGYDQGGSKIGITPVPVGRFPTPGALTPRK